ncbi:innexin [Elysia marginata]|uniref:Innexin n=1 Tax=Elysia marginata TaxID=1093978 RepID=A0AAV4ETX5_9GAST|nr:innexin [Elysia marginata]
MDKLVMKFVGVLIGNQIKGDDFVDRLYYHVTSAALLLLAAGTGYEVYSGDPIECSMLNQVTNSNSKNVNTNTHNNEDSINSYCLARQLHRPDALQDATAAYLIDFGTAFFKWAPFVFIFQAFMFKLPNVLWKHLSANSTKELGRIRDLIEDARALEDDKAKRHKMDEVVVYFETWVTGYKSYSKNWIKGMLAVFFCCGKNSGSYLSSLYISVKILNLLVVFLCSGLLIGFFDGEFWKYGLTAVEKVYTTGDWEDSINFPKKLICDFDIPKNASVGTKLPEITNLSPSSVLKIIPANQIRQAECTMSINFLLEKVFLLEWFWLILLGWLTIFNMFTWIGKIKQPLSTVFFTRDYMATIDSLPSAEDGSTSLEADETASSEQVTSLQKSFVNEYLRSDGVFLLRVLEVNSGRAIVGELVISLWKRYKKIQHFHASRLSLDRESLDNSVGSSNNNNNNNKRSSFWKRLSLGKFLPKPGVNSAKDLIPQSELGDAIKKNDNAPFPNDSADGSTLNTASCSLNQCEGEKQDGQCDEEICLDSPEASDTQSKPTTSEEGPQTPNLPRSEGTGLGEDRPSSDSTKTLEECESPKPSFDTSSSNQEPDEIQPGQSSDTASTYSDPKEDADTTDSIPDTYPEIPELEKDEDISLENPEGLAAEGDEHSKTQTEGDVLKSNTLNFY